ncbi:MAG: peptidoglycan-binding protein [Spirochaetales bacterium]|nr:peptidoglycan-binding protein [Spirochaetales bacterium]
MSLTWIVARRTAYRPSCTVVLSAQDLSPEMELYLRDPEPRFHGEQVEHLQRFLLFSGMDIGSDGIDGWFGRDTDRALRSYQQAYGLPVTGHVRIGEIPTEFDWELTVEPVSAENRGERLDSGDREMIEGDILRFVLA